VRKRKLPSMPKVRDKTEPTERAVLNDQFEMNALTSEGRQRYLSIAFAGTIAGTLDIFAAFIDGVVRGPPAAYRLAGNIEWHLWTDRFQGRYRDRHSRDHSALSNCSCRSAGLFRCQH
jgi:hypothetical protein